MRYSQFRNKYLNLPLIFSRDILKERNSDKQAVLNQLKRWQDRKLIIKLKKGVYLLNANDRKINPSRPFIANQLYLPSYVSLEYALSFYDLIPERVNQVTSITTKKTATFRNETGVFVYQHIQPKAFRGFREHKDESGLIFFIAEPEKAMVDFLYLNMHEIKSADLDVFSASYRFQNTALLRKKKIMELSALFNNRKLTKLSVLFCEFMAKEAGR